MLTVGAFTTYKPTTIASASTLAAARERMRAHGVRHLPVTKDRRLVGMVSDRDLRAYEGRHDQARTVGDVMTPFAFTVPHDTPLAEVASRMGRARYGSVLVRNARGTLGIFTTLDALRALTFTARALPLMEDGEVEATARRARPRSTAKAAE